MLHKPKALTTTFFNWRELFVSIVQGLLITAGTLFVYRYAVSHKYDEAGTRTMVFTVLISANIFLTLINRSFYYSICTTMKYKNNLVPLILFITIAIVSLLLFVKPLTSFFEFERLNAGQLLICITIGFSSVIWFEIVKLIRRKSTQQYIASA